MAMDTNALIQNVIQHALVSATGNQPPDVSPDGVGSEGMIAKVLGDRLGQMFAGSNSEPDDTDMPLLADEAEEDFDLYDELLERNSVLAAALGACDCWGEDAGCDICRGTGEPGSMLPDRRLFARFVQPALRAIRRANGAPANAPFKPKEAYKEDDDGQLDG